MRLSRNVRRFSSPLSITSKWMPRQKNACTGERPIRRRREASIDLSLRAFVKSPRPSLTRFYLSFPSSVTSSSACTDKLRQNDPSFVELSLERVGENFDIDEFVYGMRVNNTVKHVHFSGTFIRELQEGQWRTMLESVGHLHTLEELQIWCSTIPVDVFADMLENATRLRKIYLFRVKLGGSQEDFDRLAAVIRGHPVLRDLRIGGFTIEEENVNLDSVVAALGACRSLEVVNLQMSAVFAEAPFSGAALALLTCSPTLSDLYLSRLGLQSEHYAVIALGLLSNYNLKALDMFGNNIDNDQVSLVCGALERNKSLETIVLPCPGDDLSVSSCAAISRVLKENKTLVRFNLPRSVLCDDGLQHIAQGLIVNTTLKKIEVGVKKGLGTKGQQALSKMLEKNFELERLVLSSAEKSVKDKVEYYMRLNEVGRGALLRDGKATREQWVEMLISVVDDLDCVFYFLSMNPSLCQFANASGADVIITEEFRTFRRHTLNNFNPAVAPPLKNLDVPRRASAF